MKAANVPATAIMVRASKPSSRECVRLRRRKFNSDLQDFSSDNTNSGLEGRGKDQSILQDLSSG
jgi:hypothetical protein